MELKKVVSEMENIKNFDVAICDAYFKQGIVYIPEPETLDPLFFDAAVKGKAKSFVILTGKN
jgi:hypothetical protein